MDADTISSHFRVEHRLRRRLRISAPSLRDDPERLYALEILLRKRPAIRAVRAIPGVQSASTASLALGGTSVMQVNASIDIDALRGALEARGWRVQQGSGVLRISRPAPPATAPSPGGG